LKSLDLRGPDFTNDHLAAIADCSQLVSLKISRAQITADGLDHLASLRKLTRIELDGRLLWNPRVIASLQRLPRLNTVDFKHNPKMKFDFAEVQDQLGAKIQLFEVTEAEGK
jgi:hypothetical protein